MQLQVDHTIVRPLGQNSHALLNASSKHLKQAAKTTISFPVIGGSSIKCGAP
jgi:hypothetical protein